MKVQELMRRKPATVQPEDGLDRAVKLMGQRNCGCVVVVDRKSKLAGMLTDRDVCLTAWRKDAPLSKIQVGDAMSTRVFTCGPDDGIAEAERLMALHQVRQLPVVDQKGRLQGLLSLDDVAREACREEGLIGPPVFGSAVGRTLGQIGRSHLIGEAGI